ncbi:MAG: hypothetical protein D3922_16475, partial [Candidatus Electrothrix sp. AR1]|nr:hypothetical protein [Candidatus Electrothrix sp. AR1]
ADILAEVRGFGEGILIAEQIPTQLVKGAVGNTNLKLMHQLEDQESFNLFCDILSLNKRQKEFARSLGQGHAVVRGHDRRPVYIKIDQYLKSNNIDEIDGSDGAIRKFMSLKPKPVIIPKSLYWEYPSVYEKHYGNLLNRFPKHLLREIKIMIDNEEWNEMEEIIERLHTSKNMGIFSAMLCEVIISAFEYTGETAKNIRMLFNNEAKL